MNDQPPPPDTPVQPSVWQLTRAEPEDVRQALAFALRYRGRKRMDSAAEAMAEITAERLVEHLAQLERVWSDWNRESTCESGVGCDSKASGWN